MPYNQPVKAFYVLHQWVEQFNYNASLGLLQCCHSLTRWFHDGETLKEFKFQFDLLRYDEGSSLTPGH